MMSPCPAILVHLHSPALSPIWPITARSGLAEGPAAPSPSRCRFVGGAAPPPDHRSFHGILSGPNRALPLVGGSGRPPAVRTFVLRTEDGGVQTLSTLVRGRNSSTPLRLPAYRAGCTGLLSRARCIRLGSHTPCVVWCRCK